MSERRNATDQPAVIYLITSRGYMQSPPLEWKDDSRVEHVFVIPSDLYVNGFFVTHSDGAIIHQSEAEMTQQGAGTQYEVVINLSDRCDDPDCTVCP